MYLFFWILVLYYYYWFYWNKGTSRHSGSYQHSVYFIFTMLWVWYCSANSSWELYRFKKVKYCKDLWTRNSKNCFILHNLIRNYFYIIPQYVLTIITTNQSIIDVAKPALRIAGFAQIFYATGVVLANGLQAAGKTLFVMLSESITNLLIFVPLAYFFGIYLKGGLIGAWLALPVYIIPYSSVIFIKFRYGDWKP